MNIGKLMLVNKDFLPFYKFKKDDIVEHIYGAVYRITADLKLKEGQLKTDWETIEDRTYEKGSIVENIGYRPLDLCYRIYKPI